jgi:hypothetical protein
MNVKNGGEELALLEASRAPLECWNGPPRYGTIVRSNTKHLTIAVQRRTGLIA